MRHLDAAHINDAATLDAVQSDSVPRSMRHGDAAFRRRPRQVERLLSILRELAAAFPRNAQIVRACAEAITRWLVSDFRFVWEQMDTRARIATVLWTLLVVPPFMEQSYELVEREVNRAARWLSGDRIALEGGGEWVTTPDLDKPTRCTWVAASDVGSECHSDPPLASMPLDAMVEPLLAAQLRGTTFGQGCLEREFLRIEEGDEPLVIVGLE